MDVRKTKKGWVLEVTNTKLGCLEVGGLCGREVLISTVELGKFGIDYNDDPESYGAYGCKLSSQLYNAYQMGMPTKVLKRGVEIR